MKLSARTFPYSSIVGGGVMLLSPTGAAMFQIGLHGTTAGISKEQTDAISARLVELINAHGLEAPNFNGALSETDQFRKPAPSTETKVMPPPVDRDQRTLTDGSPVTADHREIQPNGQQKAYVVLSEAERARGFVRPVRRTYVHQKCGVATTMGASLAETYARDPSFYSGTFCVGCRTHFKFGEPDGDFTWDDGSKVGE